MSLRASYPVFLPPLVVRPECPMSSLWAHKDWADNEKTFPPTQWQNLYKMVNAPIHYLKRRGLSVVFTSRLKDSYTNNVMDGGFRVDAFRNQKDLADLMLIIGQDGSLEVDKNSWADIMAPSIAINRSQTLPEMIRALMQ